MLSNVNNELCHPGPEVFPKIPNSPLGLRFAPLGTGAEELL